MMENKYIAGYEKVSKEMLIPFHVDVIDDVIANVIPIYTIKKPNPKSGKPDCNITTREKEHFRNVMKMKLQAAGTEEERQKVIDHYKSKWSEV